MVAFKLFLILILTISFVIFSFSSKMKTVKKLSAIGGYILMFLFIVFPHYSDRVAQIFGIGLGKDLIVYILVALTGLISIVLYSGVNSNHSAITKMIREDAKRGAKKCK